MRLGATDLRFVTRCFCRSVHRYLWSGVIDLTGAGAWDGSSLEAERCTVRSSWYKCLKRRIIAGKPMRDCGIYADRVHPIADADNDEPIWICCSYSLGGESE